MDLVQTAKAWISQDPDPETRQELESLIAAGDLAALESRFETRLAFGTAGLRGEIGAGPNRMNRVVVSQTALAIGNFLLSSGKFKDPAGEISVVIGYDGRINSDIFAKDSAEILSGLGISVQLFDRPVPTPVACFTGARRGASATIVVTASHNPPRDNGYKVYLGGELFGSQLVPPQDAEIANWIEKIAAGQSVLDFIRSQDYSLLSEAEIELYRARARELVPESNPNRSSLKISYTAMHGVGYQVIKPLFDELGFNLESVKEQQEPDGSFPTVSFPNPEEPGAMDLSLAHAKLHHSDLIIANDPDADRLAVGVLHLGNYKMLTGDQVGLILADAIASQMESGSIANSIVSAPLNALALHYGVSYQQTLTGFKWISKVPELRFGYEEALGYCVDPSHTPDKDGITAALLIADLAANLAAKGKTLLDLLETLAGRYGHLSTGQVSLRVSDLAVIGQIMESLRSNPVSEILGDPVEYEDLLLGLRLQATDGLVFRNSKLQVIIRPSGTEPKLKCYLHYFGDSAEDADLGIAALKEFATELFAARQ